MEENIQKNLTYVCREVFQRPYDKYLFVYHIYWSHHSKICPNVIYKTLFICDTSVITFVNTKETIGFSKVHILIQEINILIIDRWINKGL